MQFLWDQLALSNPAWNDHTDAQMYAERRDQHRLYQFLIALRDDFKLVRGQFLHRAPLPTLDKAVCDLVREDTRFHTMCYQHTQPTHLVLAAHFFGASSSPHESFDKSRCGPSSKNRNNNYCRYCQCCGHTINKC
jgi:hypothetical protein